MPAKFAGSSTEGVADHGRRKSQRFFFDFIYITSGLSYHLQQKMSKNTLPCSVQPFFSENGRGRPRPL